MAPDVADRAAPATRGRLIAAAVASVLVVVVTVVAVTAAIGRYLDGACWSRIGDGAGRGPWWDPPATVRCEFVTGTVVVTDWLPAVAVVLGALAGGLIVGALWRAAAMPARRPGR